MATKLTKPKRINADKQREWLQRKVDAISELRADKLNEEKEQKIVIEITSGRWY